ncbi:MAG TPA: PrgI family protein [Candidatus Saccharimonadales bacterium]
MATYKLIQDIEAEDKILGPLTLRQFIFGLVAVFLFYLCFIVVVKHLLFLLVVFFPPALFCGFFALPFGRDQPTEIWFLAKLRFWFKPRSRVWNQSGLKEVVTITVPKKEEHVLTNGLSENEVNSRLQVLAQTLDSRGWAVKHVEPGAFTAAETSSSSDRLLSFDNLPQEVPAGDNSHPNDMLDAATNPIARQFDNMITQSSQVRRQELMSRLNAATSVPAMAGAGTPGGDSPWFMSQGSAMMSAPVAVTAAAGGGSAPVAGPTSSRQAFGNLRTFQPTAPASVNPMPADQPAVADDSLVPAPDDPLMPMTATDDPAILSLAKNNDLDVATLARQAKKNRPNESRSTDEVVISLH